MIVALVAAACGWLYTKRTKAAAQLGFGQPGCIAYIPREWGEYKGGSQQSGLAFQNSAGTLRFLTNIPCGSTPQVALEIRRNNAPNGRSWGEKVAAMRGEGCATVRRGLLQDLAASGPRENQARRPATLRNVLETTFSELFIQ